MTKTIKSNKINYNLIMSKEVLRVAKNAYRPWVRLLVRVSILRILAEGSTYGNRIAEELRQRTRQVVSPNPNTLYPLLRELEEAGYIRGQWADPDKRNRRVYELTAEGKAFLPELERNARAHFVEMEQNITILRAHLFGEGMKE